MVSIQNYFILPRQYLTQRIFRFFATPVANVRMNFLALSSGHTVRSSLCMSCGQLRKYITTIEGLKENDFEQGLKKMLMKMKKNFSCNGNLSKDDEILIQQRASTKYHSPKLWANSVCTSPIRFSSRRPYSTKLSAIFCSGASLSVS